MNYANEFDGAFEALIDLLNILLDEADDKMLLFLSSRKQDEIRLTMPDFLIKKLPEAFAHKYKMMQPGDVGKLFVFRGISIEPSSDMTITLFHKDYPLYKE